MTRRYEVVPFQKDWQVRFGDIQMAAFTERDPAVRDGRALAEANRPSVLVVRDQDGNVESEETFDA